jgi:diguanylate cyclase (GGDEF)-like protein
MADIDHFKHINDTYGHPVGDEVLRAVAGKFHENLREVDIIYRYGGEEFLILLPETSSDGAIYVAERLRTALFSNVLRKGNRSSFEIRVTASFGVASFSINDLSHTDLIARADLGLYQAKKAGRNRVECLC